MLDQKAALEKVGDVLATNADNGLSNKVALLDRDIDVPDRFTGETRDHVLEVVREARDKAEAEGRLRRAQLLEGVLAANEPEGTLAKKRANLEKLFADNGNIVSGPVIAELEKMGISHKNGEDYLLPAEIIKRLRMPVMTPFTSAEIAMDRRISSTGKRGLVPDVSSF
jgi:hypothetical protein